MKPNKICDVYKNSSGIVETVFSKNVGCFNPLVENIKNFHRCIIKMKKIFFMRTEINIFEMEAEITP